MNREMLQGKGRTSGRGVGQARIKRPHLTQQGSEKTVISGFRGLFPPMGPFRRTFLYSNDSMFLYSKLLQYINFQQVVVVWKMAHLIVPISQHGLYHLCSDCVAWRQLFLPAVSLFLFLRTHQVGPINNIIHRCIDIAQPAFTSHKVKAKQIIPIVA